MKKRTFPTELCYALGIVILALGTAFMEKADFGLSTVVAPAYLLYLKLGETFRFLTFGMMEYFLQAFLLVAMVIVLRRFRVSYLFSFVTAVLYGLALDGCMALVAYLPADTFIFRALWYVVGLVVCALGVSFFFRSYLAPEVYELFVKELSRKLGKDMGKVKIVYDCVSCALAIVMSFCFFGLWHFEGVKLGTVICALVNGHIINFFGRLMERHFTMKDALPLRKYFEKTETGQHS